MPFRSARNSRAVNGQCGVLRIALAAVSCAVAIAACGSSSTASASSHTTTSKQKAYSELLTFSKCDRRLEMPPRLFPNPTLGRPANSGLAPVKTTAHNALTVPVAALVPEPSGEYHVEVAGPGNTRSEVPVSIGYFDVADGRVQATGALIRGQRVAFLNRVVIDHGGAFLAIPQIFHLQSRAFRQAAAACGSARLKLGL